MSLGRQTETRGRREGGPSLGVLKTSSFQCHQKSSKKPEKNVNYRIMRFDFCLVRVTVQERGEWIRGEQIRQTQLIGNLSHAPTQCVRLLGTDTSPDPTPWSLSFGLLAIFSESPSSCSPFPLHAKPVLRVPVWLSAKPMGGYVPGMKLYCIPSPTPHKQCSLNI